MDYTSKDLSKTKKQLTIKLDDKQLEAAKVIAVRKMAKTAKIPGFRPGKVPASVAEKHLDPVQVANEALELAINTSVSEIIEKENIRVLDRPSVDVKSFEPYTALEFTADIEVLAPIKLGDYKKLKAKKSAIKLEQTEIDEVINRVRGGYAEKSSVVRAAKKGDEVIIDFEGRDDKGDLIEGAAGDDYTLKLGSGNFVPGFEEQIIGRAAGEEFAIDVTFPDDYHAEHLKSAKVTFKINLKKVQEVKLPEVNDELAKKSGPFETVKELKDDIKRELTAQKDREATNKYKDDLLAELAEKSEVPLADVLVHDQIHAIERDMMQNLIYRGMTIEQYVQTQGFKDEQDWRENELRPAGERRVISGLVLAELSKVLGIEVSKDELEAELAKRKAEMSTMASQLDTPDARRDLANRVMTEKTLDKLIEINSPK